MLTSDSAKTPYSLLQSLVGEVIHLAIMEKRLVGAVVKIAIEGELVYSNASGFADREANRPMDENALFRLASVSKPIVSAAALVLISQGKMGLDDEISNWLPEFRPHLPNGEPAKITVRQLLTHTAGLGYGFLEKDGNGPYHRAGVSDGMDRTGITLEENLLRLASVPLLYEPGTNWGYSLATDVLGAVISRATNAPLSNAISKLVTQPLGMLDTSFSVLDEKRLVTPYVNDAPHPRRMRDLDIVPVFEGTAGIRFEPARAFDTDAFASGGSGMIGTAGDVLHLLEVLRQGGNPILPAELVREMGSIQTGDMSLVNWPGRGFGLGFTVLHDPHAGHTSESPGTWRLGGAYGHSWFVDPARKLSVVAFTNTAYEGMSGPFTVALTEAIYQGIKP